MKPSSPQSFTLDLPATLNAKSTQQYNNIDGEITSLNGNTPGVPDEYTPGAPNGDTPGVPNGYTPGIPPAANQLRPQAHNTLDSQKLMRRQNRKR